MHSYSRMICHLCDIIVPGRVILPAGEDILQRDIHKSHGTHRRLHAHLPLVTNDRHVSTWRHDWCFLSWLPGWPHRQV